MDRSAIRRLAPFLAASAVLTFSLVLLHRELRAHSVSQIVAGLRSLPLHKVGLSALLAGGSYAALTGYDRLAMRYVGASLTYPRVALASFMAYAFSNTLGFPLLTGAPIRYRMYTGWGLEGADIARALAFASATFWLGFLALAGSAFLASPPALPGPLAGVAAMIRPLGAVFLGVSVGYLAWCRWGPSEIRVRSWTLPTPSLRIGVRQLVVSATDWLCASAALYVLLPDDLGLSYPPFLAAFLLAQILGLLSHVPGGLGVFELVLLIALRERAESPALVTSLLAFRGLYYFLPLLLAAVSLGGFEILSRRERLSPLLAELGSGISLAVPIVVSGAVFLAGAIMLVEGALPAQGYLGSLARWAPLAVVEASHLLGSVAGALLLILAWGLARRLDGAYHAALILLGAGALLSAFRPGGILTALIAVAVLVALAPARREFFRHSTLLAEPLSREWMFGVSAVGVSTAWLGIFANRSVPYSGDLWWRFAFEADAPRFLRASVAGAAVVLTFAVARLLRPAEPKEAEQVQEPPPQIDVIAAATDRASVHLAFLGDKGFVLSRSGRACLMYGVEGRSWVAMGDPFGDVAEYAELVWDFRNRVHRHGGWAVFYQVRPEFLSLYVDQGLTLVKLGEEAVVDPRSFSLVGGHRAGMRWTLRKVEKDGGGFAVLQGDEVREAMPRLREISDRWLEAKHAREKGFSLGSFREEYVARFPVAVVRTGSRIDAFANLWLAAPATEYCADLMRYDPERAPSGSMDYLFLKLIAWGAEQGYSRFNLGTAPLSGLESGPLAPLWARMGHVVFRYGEHFYNFRGLRAYKEKFDPVWEPRYLASPGGSAFPGILAGIAALIAGGLRGVVAR
jgi:phosphatidylglycerol lysyltransferase